MELVFDPNRSVVSQHVVCCLLLGVLLLLLYGPPGRARQRPCGARCIEDWIHEILFATEQHDVVQRIVKTDDGHSLELVCHRGVQLLFLIGCLTSNPVPISTFSKPQNDPTLFLLSM